jgi:hypothetical protein
MYWTGLLSTSKKAKEPIDKKILLEDGRSSGVPRKRHTAALQPNHKDDRTRESDWFLRPGRFSLCD